MQPVLIILLSAATALSLASTVPSAAAEIDCGPKPTLTCLAPHIFALARALPESDEPQTRHSPPALSSWRKEMLRFAEEELAPANLEIALRCFIEDFDPYHWEGVPWVASAGRIDRAIALAETEDTPGRRIGGLLEVAKHLLDAGQKARAAAILRRVEPELSRGFDNSPDYAVALRTRAAEAWARIGQPANAIRLLRHPIVPRSAAAANLAEIAQKHPAASAVLRREAWTQAEIANDADGWLAIAKAAAERNDVPTVAEAGRRALTAPFYDDRSRNAIEVAEIFIKAGLTEQAGQAIDPWRSWAAGMHGAPLRNLLRPLIATLARLGRDGEVEEAAHMLAEPSGRSRELIWATRHAIGSGWRDAAKQLEDRALAAAEAFINDPAHDRDAVRPSQDGAFASLATLRNNRGDFWGALTLAAKIRDEAVARDTTVSLIGRAIERGHGATAIPILERLQAGIRKDDPKLLLKLAELWARAGRNEMARAVLNDALALWRDPAAGKPNLWDVVPVFWEVDRNPQAIEAALAPFIADEQDRTAIREALSSAALRTSSGDAVRLAGEIPDPLRRLEALEQIARKLAESK